MFFKKKNEIQYDEQRVIKAAATVAIYWGARKAVSPESLDDLVHSLNAFHQANPGFFEANPADQKKEITETN